jgi:hypothetical protein
VRLRPCSASGCQQPVELNRSDRHRRARHACREGFQEGAQVFVVESGCLGDDGGGRLDLLRRQYRRQLGGEVLGKWTAPRSTHRHQPESIDSR